MVTDSLSLVLLSRLANFQLSLATSMKGISQDGMSYPGQSLERITRGLDALEVLLEEVARLRK